MIKVDAKAIQLGTGCTPALANAYLELIVGAAIKYDINTIRRFAGWLANVGIESDGLSAEKNNCMARSLFWSEATPIMRHCLLLLGVRK